MNEETVLPSMRDEGAKIQALIVDTIDGLQSRLDEALSTISRLKKEIAAEQKRDYPSHKDMCEMFGIQRSHPAPHWTSYAVELTRIEVYVMGNRRSVFGGAMECGRCGFGVSMQPDEHTTPKRPADNSCPKCGALSPDAPKELAVKGDE